MCCSVSNPQQVQKLCFACSLSSGLMFSLSCRRSLFRFWMKKWTESRMLLLIHRVYSPVFCIGVELFSLLTRQGFWCCSLPVVTLQRHHHVINFIYQPTRSNELALAFSWAFSCLTKRPAPGKLTTASLRNIQHVWLCLARQKTDAFHPSIHPCDSRPNQPLTDSSAHNIW